MLVLPLPDFGRGPKIALDAWSWGLTRQCKDTQSAMHLIEFLLRDEEVVTTADATGRMPALKSALAMAEDYNKGGQLAMLPVLMEHVALMPESSMYSYIAGIFQKAFDKIRDGDNVHVIMSKAAVAASRVLAGEQKKHQGQL